MLAMKIEPSLSGIGMPMRLQARRPLVLVHQNLRDVYFSGTPGKQSFSRKIMLVLATLLSLLPVIAQGQTSQVTLPTPQTGIVTMLNQGQVKKINTAADLRRFLEQSDKTLADLANNPLFTAETQQKLKDILKSFDVKNDGDLAVLVVPDTDATGSQMAKLAQNLLQELKLGEKGKDNGMLVLLNADAIKGKETTSNQIAMATGRDAEVAVDYAIKLIDAHAREALLRGDVNKAATELITAVSKFVETGNSGKVQATAPLSQNQKQAILLVSVLGVLLISGCAALDIKNRDYHMPRTRLALEIIFRILITIVTKGKGTGGRSGGGFRRVGKDYSSNSGAGF